MISEELKNELESIFIVKDIDSLLFVKSIDQIAEDNPNATSKTKFNVLEVLELYGLDTLRKIASDGSAPNPCALQIGDSLKYQREKLKLDKLTISITANITLETLEMLETGKRLPIKDYENIAIVLGLDERYLGIKYPCPER